MGNTYIDCGMRKHVFGHMRTAKAQINLRIRAVWSGPTLSANRIIRYFRMYQWRANARMKLCMRLMNQNLCIVRMLENTFSTGAAQSCRNVYWAALWLGKLTALDMTLLDWLDRQTSTQTNTNKHMRKKVYIRHIRTVKIWPRAYKIFFIT